MNEQKKFWGAFVVIIIIEFFISWFLGSFFADIIRTKNPEGATENREFVPGIEQAGNGINESIDKEEP